MTQDVSDGVQEVVRDSLILALERHTRIIGTDTLLIVALRHQESRSVQVLADHGITYDAIYVQYMASHETGAPMEQLPEALLSIRPHEGAGFISEAEQIQVFNYTKPAMHVLKALETTPGGADGIDYLIVAILTERSSLITWLFDAVAAAGRLPPLDLDAIEAEVRTLLP